MKRSIALFVPAVLVCVLYCQSGAQAGYVYEFELVSPGVDVAVTFFDGGGGGRADMVFSEVLEPGFAVDAAYGELSPVEFQAEFGVDPNSLDFYTPTQTSILIYSFTCEPEGMSFAGPCTLTMYWTEGTFPPDDPDETGPLESKVDIYWFDPVGGVWEPQHASCDLVNNFCTLQITHFSTFTIGEAVPEPATMSLLALGLGALVIRRRRRW